MGAWLKVLFYKGTNKELSIKEWVRGWRFSFTKEQQNHIKELSKSGCVACKRRDVHHSHLSRKMVLKFWKALRFWWKLNKPPAVEQFQLAVEQFQLELAPEGIVERSLWLPGLVGRKEGGLSRKTSETSVNLWCLGIGLANNHNNDGDERKERRGAWAGKLIKPWCLDIGFVKKPPHFDHEKALNHIEGWLIKIYLRCW